MAGLVAFGDDWQGTYHYQKRLNYLKLQNQSVC
jgi:hypothetical protein